MAARQWAATTPENDTDKPPQKPPPGGRCRQLTAVAIHALLDLVDEIAVDGKVDRKDIHRIAEAILAGEGPLATVYAHSEQKCTFAFHRAAIECQRKDAFGRLVVEPIATLLDQPDGIERKRLGQFLAAIRMMVGEEAYEDLHEKAVRLANEHRDVEGIVDWDEFHAAPTAAEVLEHVLVSVANSFRRFDARRDWFLVVLNANPSAVSTASNAFVPLKPEDRAHFAFTEGHMARIFDALFASVRRETFTSDRLRLFGKRWSASPDKIFGPLFLEVARLHQHGD